MKKNLVFTFLVLFILSTAAFAGLSDPKKEADKPVINSPVENKLSDEESSRMSRRADIDNLSNPSLSNKDKAESKNDLKAPAQVYVEGNNHHHGYYWGGAGLILLIILIIVLV